ncbi:MAG: SHOCT domain-containing protein [Fibromonadaceae bacterium]|nr:SHOCT domain-containing protein [Fibromonadaceae bacterium]
MKTSRFLLVVGLLFATLTLSCAKKPALRPAVSQTAITVQRNDPNTNEGGEIYVFIDNEKKKNGIKDRQTESYIVNNGVHVIHIECPKGESAGLNFTANDKTVAFLSAYESPGLLAFFGSPKCRLERMSVDDDTGYMTDRKTQQSYNEQKKDNSSQNYNATEELEKLANLKNKGIITEEEFNAKKKQLLGL